MRHLFQVGLFLSLFSSYAHATKIDLMPFVQFAAEWTGHEYKGQPLPKIKFERHEIVQIFAYGDYEYAQAEAKGEKLAEVNAVYVPEEKTVYISNQLDLGNPKTKATLAHEMVHYLQDVSGYTKSLAGHLACTESEAYDVQMLWQKMNHVDVENLPFVHQQSMLSAMKCMGDQSADFKKAFGGNTTGNSKDLL